MSSFQQFDREPPVEPETPSKCKVCGLLILDICKFILVGLAVTGVIIAIILVSWGLGYATVQITHDYNVETAGQIFVGLAELLGLALLGLIVYCIVQGCRKRYTQIEASLQPHPRQSV